MDFPFEGIPTVPPRKDMDHMASTFVFFLFSLLLCNMSQSKSRYMSRVTLSVLADLLLRGLQIQSDSIPRLESCQGVSESCSQMLDALQG